AADPRRRPHDRWSRQDRRFQEHGYHYDLEPRQPVYPGSGWHKPQRNGAAGHGGAARSLRARIPESNPVDYYLQHPDARGNKVDCRDPAQAVAPELGEPKNGP